MRYTGIKSLKHLMLLKAFGYQWIYIVNKDHEKESKRRSINREQQSCIRIEEYKRESLNKGDKKKREEARLKGMPKKHI